MTSYAYKQHRRPQLDVSGGYTRNHPEYDTDAERLCRDLLALAESLGDSPALTRAKTALEVARNEFASHVERTDRLWLERWGTVAADTDGAET